MRCLLIHNFLTTYFRLPTSPDDGRQQDYFLFMKNTQHDIFDVSLHDFDERVIEASRHKPILVDFWADWCGPCKVVAPAVEDIARQYRGKLKVCKLNVDEAPQIAANYGIMSIPTLSIFKSGQVMEQIVGTMPKSELEERIKPYIG